MTSVFIGGSRRLSRLNSQLMHRFDNIIEKGFRVLIGDANGFDKASQSYLADRGYREVVIYCTAGKWRNNVGDWPIQAVEYAGKDRGLEFYTAKDDAMLKDADYGFFGWDGESKGTLRNVRKMAEMGKPSAVYVSPTRQFITIRDINDVEGLTKEFASSLEEPGDLFSAAWKPAPADSSTLGSL